MLNLSGSEGVPSACITVPSSAPAHQRKLLASAAQSAGIKLLSLIEVSTPFCFLIKNLLGSCCHAPCRKSNWYWWRMVFCS
jgi:hypothetical protein